MGDWDELDWYRVQLFARSEAMRVCNVYQQRAMGFYELPSAEWLLDFFRSLL